VFHVIHVHHGLSRHADEWAEKCKLMCQHYHFDYHVKHLKLEHAIGDSLEESAREARYQVFAAFMKDDDLLLTAHHQDDQAETLLLQLLRGAGPKGLSAMPVMKPFARGFHARPMLSFARHEILAYAKARQLTWVEDESNENRSFTRNFIRHDIMPLLKSRWPKVENAMARSAMHCAESQSLLEEIAHDKLKVMQGSRSGTLSVVALLSQSEPWQRLLLRAWIERRGYALPDTNKINSIQKTVLQSAWDRTPCVRWQTTEVRRHRDDIYILEAGSHFAIDDVWEWDMTTTLSLATAGRLLAIPKVGSGLRAGIGMVTVRFRVPGEAVMLSARGRLSLKNLFQEWRVPVWERGIIPLIFCGEKLIEVLGYFVDPDYAAKEDEAGVELKLERA
jgi:tRNA(Ile)-lysidine synthase